MKVSYSCTAAASAAEVSASKRAKSDSITSSMPTTPPFSACMPLYGASKISGEVRLDHFQHAHDPAVLGLHALVRRIEDLGRLGLCLHQCGCLACLGVELLQDRQSLCDGRLGFASILDG